MRIDRVTTYMQRVGDRPRVLVRIDTDEGLTGWGEAYNHGPDRALAPTIEYLTDIIAGQDPRDVERIHQLLLRSMRFPQGAVGLAAISAIDHALWDIAARAVDAPVYALLGGAVRERVPVYCGLYAAPDPLEVRDITARVNEEFGYTAFKLNPFRGDIHSRRWGSVVNESAAYFAAVRESSDPRWDFAFDAHGMLLEPYKAVQLGKALEPWQPLFLEEPIRPENMPAWGRLRTELTIALATGESLYSPFEFQALLSVGGADIVQPDITVVGGLSQMRRIATIAETHYVPVAPHNPMGPLATAHNVHFAAACSNFLLLEFKPDDTTWCPDPYIPRDGHLDLRPDRPGWGVAIDERALATDDYVSWQRRVPVKPDGSWGQI